MVRWMFDEEIAAATVLTPRKSRLGGELQDPVMMLLEMEGGALIDVEIWVNIRYGYDIRGEVVGEEGTAALGESSPVTVRKVNMYSGRVPKDWRGASCAPTTSSCREWIDAVRDGGEFGPSAWDGYAAAVGSDTAVSRSPAVALGSRSGSQPGTSQTPQEIGAPAILLPLIVT